MTMPDLSCALTLYGPELGPAPRRRSLVAHVPCGDLSSDLDAGVHPVVIGPDWSVDVGHDLGPERVAAVLGGSPSCLHLVEHVVPALRTAVQVLTRRGLLVIRHQRRQGAWVVANCLDCGDENGPLEFDAVGPAVEHARTVGHLARAHRCDERLLALLLCASDDAHGGFEYAPRGAADRLVREPGGAQLLWDVGIHPGWAQAAHEHLWPDDQSLPARFYVGLAYLRPRAEYVRNMIEARPDPDLATWAVWSETAEDRRSPRVRSDVVRAQADVTQLMNVVDSGYALEEVRHLSRHSMRSTREAVAALDGWVRIGCRPHVADLSWGIGRVLADDRLIPAEAQLERLLASLPSDCVPSRTEAGLVLAVARTVDRAREMLSRGVRSATAAFEHLEDAGLVR